MLELGPVVCQAVGGTDLYSKIREPLPPPTSGPVALVLGLGPSLPHPLQRNPFRPSLPNKVLRMVLSLLNLEEREAEHGVQEWGPRGFSCQARNRTWFLAEKLPDLS